MNHKKLFEDLKRVAEIHKPLWKDCQTYVAPTRGYFDSNPNKKKSIDHQILLDSHATWCLKVFASGLTSGLTSPSRPWFKLSLHDQSLMKYRPVREYLEDVQKAILDVYSKSNIYGILNTAYEELGAFGTASASIEEDFQDFIRGKSYTSGEYFVGVNSKGRVDQFAREFDMTVYQVVQEFGIDNVKEDTRRKYKEKNLQEWIKIKHLIKPNDKRNPLKHDAKNKAYSSYYWEAGMDEDEFLRVSGFDFFPVIASRWAVTTTSDIYGYGPSVEALGDIKMLQKLQLERLKSVEKVNDPPMKVDGSVTDVNVFPGGLTRSNSLNDSSFRPAYQINPDINAIRQTILDTKESISKFYYTDMFLMMQNDTRSGITAREIVERHEEKLLMLGPTLERIENEMLDPLIDITYNYLSRMGVLPPAPEELQGMDINVEYVSTLAQAQKMVATTAINQTTQFVGGLASVKPDVLDVFDLDQLAIEYAESVGLSAKGYRSKAEIQKIREDREAAIAQQQQAANLQSMIAGAKTLSETQVNNNSALDALMGVRADVE